MSYPAANIGITTSKDMFSRPFLQLPSGRKVKITIQIEEVL